MQDLDLANLGLDFASGAALGSELANAAASDGGFSGSPSDGEFYQALSESQANSLLTALGNDTEAVQYIDYLLNEAKEADGVDADKIDE